MAVAGAVVVLHGAVAIALIAGMRAARAPSASATLVSAIPIARPPPAISASPARQAARAAPGRQARAAFVGPPPMVAVPGPSAAPVAGTQSAAQAGAVDQGDGPGGGGSGSGDGGRHVVTAPVKIAGDLAEPDFPAAGRAARLGTAVIVVLTVGTDGRASTCRIHRPSGDPATDTVTCTLARDRFRFEPARDQYGDPIAAPFGWEQRFFTKQR